MVTSLLATACTATGGKAPVHRNPAGVVRKWLSQVPWSGGSPSRRPTRRDSAGPAPCALLTRLPRQLLLAYSSASRRSDRCPSAAGRCSAGMGFSPRRHPSVRVRAALAGLLPLLLLLLSPPAVRGDCGLPPEVPNAQPVLEGPLNFPEQATVTYKCEEGFVKVPGLSDSTLCVDGNWSEVAEFCNRSCDVPPRLLFASLQKTYSKQNYFPEGSMVEYECREGYEREYTLSGNLTCLQNFVWSKPEKFCKKKSCPSPGEIKNGHVSITSDILFGASISFSCDTGYILEGEAFSYCLLRDNTVRWSNPLPECKEIHCPEPPEVVNGMIQEPQTTYVYKQSVTYKCAKGFNLIGEKSIRCVVKDEQGVWSGPAPECKAKQSPAAPKATTRVYATSTAKERGPLPSGTNVIAYGYGLAC